MTGLKSLALVSVVLLICDFSIANSFESYWTEYNGTVIIDRSKVRIESPGFYMDEVDRTVFAVNRDILLERIDIAPIFEYNSEEPIPLKVNHLALVKLMETSTSGYPNTLCTVNATVNSAYESEVYFHPEIQLNRDSIYEIQLQIQHAPHAFMYKDTIGTNEYFVNTTYHGRVGVKFYQRNPNILPPNATDMIHKLSHGVVKRLHLSY